MPCKVLEVWLSSARQIHAKLAARTREEAAIVARGAVEAAVEAAAAEATVETAVEAAGPSARM